MFDFDFSQGMPLKIDDKDYVSIKRFMWHGKAGWVEVHMALPDIKVEAEFREFTPKFFIKIEPNKETECSDESKPG